MAFGEGELAVRDALKAKGATSIRFLCEDNFAGMEFVRNGRKHAVALRMDGVASTERAAGRFLERIEGMRA